MGLFNQLFGKPEEDTPATATKPVTTEDDDLFSDPADVPPEALPPAPSKPADSAPASELKAYPLFGIFYVVHEKGSTEEKVVPMHKYEQQLQQMLDASPLPMNRDQTIQMMAASGDLKAVVYYVDPLTNEPVKPVPNKELALRIMQDYDAQQDPPAQSEPAPAPAPAADPPVADLVAVMLTQLKAMPEEERKAFAELLGITPPAASTPPADDEPKATPAAG